VRGVIAGLQAAGAEVPGFDAVVHATLPGGGGLSSSAALEVAMATLGELLAGVTLDPERRALLCQKAEHDFAGTPCGIMDQFAVVFGKRGHLLLIDCQSRARTLVSMRGDDVSLLVINTMVKHELNDGGYKSRRDDCYEAARLLGVGELRDATPQRVDEERALLPERLFRRARHVVTENVRTLAAVDALRAGEWQQLGELMYASHASLRDDYDVSCAELDAVVAAARGLGPERGVFGCRMTGGGFGGCCIALVQAARAAEVEAALRASYRAATGIEPTIFATQPADGPAVLLQP
jgi:galactokinase